jgi:hypothetical protein
MRRPFLFLALVLGLGSFACGGGGDICTQVCLLACQEEAACRMVSAAPCDQGCGNVRCTRPVTFNPTTCLDRVRSLSCTDLDAIVHGDTSSIMAQCS